ncbi:DNA-binding NtrC family response regulator [Methylohalomonas lacus]|uniref:DNA-binding NtrC family response regulator n=1 Tax=Methylohalomonas lacus TaxID=398773 RepID=A0AAE3L3Q5_9GAMM|nr:sigma-54 dependent transcriptional regulator [Methylohalomonas lacus]MCS3902543.1 DNA-binding NtrC family response regulator [Methylohalomonas lacus]
MAENTASATSSEVPVQKTDILIVEDEAVLAKAVSKRLNRNGYQTRIAGDLKSAYRYFKEQTPDMILLDMRLPDGSGLDFLADLREQQQSQVPVLVMSAYGELEDAVAAMKLGAADYLKKPVDLDELVLNVEKVMEKATLSRKLDYSATRERHASAESVQFLGECEALKQVQEQIQRIAELTRQQTDAPPPTVLILGETGTGKDVLARLLHDHSARQEQPFVQVDCASLPKDLIEAELFGHEKGAFTSAHSARTGLIEAAEDGVLFLDEIGEIPLDLQSKLLAVLERRVVRRVGTTQERPVDAWFIAATNRDIDRLVEQGEFRSDLYYRLNVLSVRLPPLRERGDDILLLARHYADRTAKRYGLGQVQFSKDAEQAMQDYNWPGNIRELRHIIERAVLLSAGGEISRAGLGLNASERPPEPTTDSSEALSADTTLEEAEYNLIKQALERTEGNVSQAARELGITRMALRYRMKKHGFDS